MRARLFSVYLLLIVIAISFTGVLSIHFTKTIYYRMVEARLLDNAKILRDYIIRHADPAAYDQIAKEYGKAYGIRLTIIDADGTVLADSCGDILEMEPHDTRPEIQDARRERGAGWSTRYSYTLGKYMMYLALPLDTGAGFVRVAMPLSEIQSSLQAQWRNVLLTLMIAFAIAIYQGHRFSLYVTKPVLEMVSLSQAMARGSFDRRIETKTLDEMGQLGEAFNAMAAKLEQSVGELRDNNLKLQAILSSMVDGILAVDMNLDIILINPTAKELFHLEEDCLGRYFLEVFRNSQMDRLLQQVLYRDAVSAIEMTTEPPKERIIRIHGAPIKEEGETVGAVVLAQDITELRRLEQVRTDFVANVSHELKTPLTSIMGFVETLKEGAMDQPDTARRFLDIIQIETERLARLINDILSLSELEFKKSQRYHARINMAAVVRETLEMMKTYARSKTISLGHLFSRNDIYIQGSPDRIKQMVINLVDNAIKYTPNGGSVTVLLEEFPERVVLRVRDTGIGIANEHIPRLFERFYRVDKGRSRSLGGTGLGLAIVKHIVLSMKGEIQVNSEPGKGTEFTIVLPKQ